MAAQAAPLSYRVARFARRYRGTVIATALVALTLVATTGFALHSMQEAQRQRDVSRAQARRAERQSEFATLMMSTAGDRPTTTAQLLGAGEKLLQNHIPNDPLFRVNSLLNLAARYSDLGETRKQADLVRQAATLAEPSADPLVRARIECSVADVERQEGRLAQGQRHLDEGFSQLARAPDAGVAYVVDCLSARADIASDQGRIAEAITTDLGALARMERAAETADERYPYLLGVVSDFYKLLGDAHQA